MQSILNLSFVRPIVIKLVRLYFRIRSIWPIWFYVLNREPRKLFLKNKPILNDIQKRVLNDLKTTGIAFTHVDELFPGQNLLPTLQGHLEENRANARVETSQPFLKYVWDFVPTLDFKNPYVKVSLSDKVLDVVNSYMSMWSNFYLLTLNITTPVGAGTEASTSQLWHRDSDDNRICKVFIYLDDVDRNAGPFTFIKGTTHGLKYGNLFPITMDMPQDFLGKTIPEDKIISGVGRAGSIIFCDATGIHMGGYAISKERLMFTASYRSKAAPYVARFKYPDNLSAQIKEAGILPQAKYALRFNTPKVPQFLQPFFSQKKSEKMQRKYQMEQSKIFVG